MVASSCSSLRTPWRGSALQQTDGVRVVGLVEDLLRWAFLDHLAGVHHADPVAHRADHAQVVSDQQDRRIGLDAQRAHEVEHLGLDRGIEAGRRLVEHEQRGSQASAIAITTRCCMPPDSWCG